jgi:hypothetical protein
MQGDGKAEITIDGITYGIRFNNLAIGEAQMRFNIELLTFEWTKSLIQIMQIIYCGILSAGEKIDWKIYYEAWNEDKIDSAQIEPIITAFRESTVISKFLIDAQKAIAIIEKEETTLKKKKLKDSLK